MSNGDSVKKEAIRSYNDLVKTCSNGGTANRAALFPDGDTKSILTRTARVGFEFTPYRVERVGKTKWETILKAMQQLAWGKPYVRDGEPTINKDALRDDRDKLTPDQLSAARIAIVRDELFYIRPIPTMAEPTRSEVA